MKKAVFLLAVFFLPYFMVLSFPAVPLLNGLITGSQAFANPFTSKPQEGKSLSHGMAHPNDGIYQTLISWQQKLRSKMSLLVRKIKTTGSPGPLFMVLAAGLAYGMVHSAGPGHGKAIALSYILTAKPGMGRGLAFSNLLAFTHACSGILLVLGVKLILDASLSTSLSKVTQSVQVLSFSLIFLLGGWILIKALLKLFTLKEGSLESVENTRPASLYSAAMIGLVPCPGVVMVMLFCMSMDLIWLGIAMGLAIGAGMALTISTIVGIAISGKKALLARLAGHGGAVIRIEVAMEAFAGFMVAGLGLFFLMTVL